jgi:hypothetical protein
MSVALNSELKEREVSSSLSFALLAGKLTLWLTLQPIIDVLAHHIPGQVIALLDDSFELLAPSVDRGQIVIGKLTPLLFDLALCLFPISFDAVPVHGRHLRKSGPLARGRAGEFRLKSRSVQWIDREVGAEPIQVTPPSSQLFFCPFEASVCDLVESPKQLRQHKHAIRWR